MPKRANEHITGEKAVSRLREVIKNEWILREVSPDYGIDCEIEIVDDNRFVTGALLKVQVKGTTMIINEKKGVYVNIDTVRYWVSFPVPTVIVYVELITNQVYWINIREYLLDNNLLESLYYSKRKSILFNFDNAMTLPENINELRDLAINHQNSVTSMKTEEEDNMVADFMGYIILVKVFDSDINQMIRYLREKASLEQLLADFPFAYWVKQQIENDPSLIDRIKTMVYDCYGKLWITKC